MAWSRIIIIAGIIILIGIQFIPVDRTNPPTSGEFKAPDQVKAVIQQSCFDCHSHETDWPWYSFIAPASWVVIRDVNEAREHLNFSRWDTLTAEEREDMQEEIWEEVSEGEMPLSMYTFAHPGTKPTEEDKQILYEWVVD